jgi:hypothetical protein
LGPKVAPHLGSKKKSSASEIVVKHKLETLVGKTFSAINDLLPIDCRKGKYFGSIYLVAIDLRVVDDDLN